MPPDIIETTPGQLNISDVAGSSSLGLEQPRRPASAATHDALFRIPNLVRGRSMTTAPNDGVCVLAADQPQSLSVIGGPGHRVRYRRVCRGWVTALVLAAIRADLALLCAGKPGGNAAAWVMFAEVPSGGFTCRLAVVAAVHRRHH